MYQQKILFTMTSARYIKNFRQINDWCAIFMRNVPRLGETLHDIKTDIKWKSLLHEAV